MTKQDYCLVSGPPCTNKTHLASAISCKSMCYGCVNWANENFLFNDGVSKNLI